MSVYNTLFSHVTIVVTGSSGTALAAKAGRSYACFINDSDTAMYLNLTGNAAVANYGIRLDANGGKYEMSQYNGNLTTSAITVIGGSTKNLLVTEGVQGSI